MIGNIHDGVCVCWGEGMGWEREMFVYVCVRVRAREPMLLE